MKPARMNEIWGVIFLLLGLFTLASLTFYHPDDIAFNTSHPANPVHNYTGVTGAYLAFGLFFVFGASAFLIPSLFLLWSACFFAQRVPEKKFFKFIGLAMALMATATLVTISVDPSRRFTMGGAIGYMAGTRLLKYFGLVGSYIMAGSCFLLSVLLATDFLIYPLVKTFAKRLQKSGSRFWTHGENLREQLIDVLGASLEETPPAKTKKAKSETLKPVSTLPQMPLKVKKYDPRVTETAEKIKAEILEESRQNSKESDKSAKPARSPKEVPAPAVSKKEDSPSGGPERFEGVIGSRASSGKYALPSIDLLKRASINEKPTDDLQENSRILERTLEEFGIEVKVVEVEQGPVITRYELMPAPGVKVNSIAALSDDLALALKAASVRLIIPIPGKSAIGVEVPNSISNIVSLREMIESRAFQSRKLTLPLVLGKTANGEPMIADLTTMPHILIAGSTGSGKTVCVNSIIMGLLYHATPEDLKFVMVDPKMVELSTYTKIPHMLTPVVTDVRKAAQVLNWVVTEMENRYKLFAAVGVRNISSFNTRPLSEETKKEIEEAGESSNIVPEKLPYIVVVIDELADLMLTARDKVEGIILRLAQLARAVGIHLILATQRPSVDVITGVIKANFPARLSFKVSSKVDSRTVLDGNGADKLIGRGDMLFMQPGDPKPIRGQAPYVTDAEINAVVKFVCEQGMPEYHPEIQKSADGKASANGADEKDELFDEAVRVVLETRQASTSNLQRRLRLGYTRAARIIDQMEAEGIIGPQQGAKPRDILMAPENAEAIETRESA